MRCETDLYDVRDGKQRALNHPESPTNSGRFNAGCFPPSVDAMTPSSFPRAGVSKHPKWVHLARARSPPSGTQALRLDAGRPRLRVLANLDAYPLRPPRHLENRACGIDNSLSMSARKSLTRSNKI